MKEYTVSNFERFLQQCFIYQVYRFFVLNLKIMRVIFKH
jgi:hypothetical protein